MFTGIIEEVGQIISISGDSLTIGAEIVTKGLTLGDSINVNGICLTVTQFDRDSFCADIMAETFIRTALRYLKSGDPVNLESAATLQKPLGGHLVQGHIDDIGEIEAINHRDDTVEFRICANPPLMRYIVEKGFIALDGISLTVVSCDGGGFTVSIVKFTWVNTRLNKLQKGDKVNLEVDIIAKYVEKFTSKERGLIDIEFLKEHGFLKT